MKSQTPEYRAWAALIQRCTNPNNAAYPSYGWRGIFVCDRWRSSFDAFLTDMGSRPDGTSLDRIDNDGGYEPGNCRWATRSVQSMNCRPDHQRGGYRPGSGQPPIAGQPKRPHTIGATEAQWAEISAASADDDEPVGPWVIDAALMRARGML